MKMMSQLLAICLMLQFLKLAQSFTGEPVTWYQGCYRTTRRHFPVINGLINVQECAEHCRNYGFNYTFVQTTSDQFQCGCAQSTVTMETAVCCDTSNMDRLQIGLRQGCWGVYGTLGPYLTMVTIEINRPVVVVNETVTLDIFTKRAAPYIVSTDDIYTGHFLEILWKLRHSREVHRETAEFYDYTEVYHRPRHTFTQPGFYTIDVQVGNGISVLEDSLDLEVVLPEPHDLQLGFPDGLTDLPACIPKQYIVRESSSSVLAVFVNTSVCLEATVSMGTNLTFTFEIASEDTGKIKTMQYHGSNTSVSQEHTFQELGQYEVTVTAKNRYGSQSLNITVIVVKKQLSDLQINLDPSSSIITTTDTPLWFIVSMVTSTRDNLYMQVEYDDGRSNIVSLSDTDGPALILAGDGKDMEIIADYGDGCELIVEFSYSYRKEGLYRPRVAIFDEISRVYLEKDLVMDTKVRSSSERSNGYSESMGNGRNALYRKGNLRQSVTKSDVDDDSNPYILDEFPFALSEGVPSENPRTQFNSMDDLVDPGYMLKEFGAGQLKVQTIVSDNQINHGNKNGEKSNVTELMSSELVEQVLIIKELDSVQLHGSSVVSCENTTEFVIQVPSRINVSVHWTLFQVFDIPMDYDNFTEKMSDDYEFINRLVYENIDSNVFTLNYTFNDVGYYALVVDLKNAISEAKTKLNLKVICPVRHLLANCDMEYIQTGHEVTCYAEAERGTHLLFDWFIDGYNTQKQFRLAGNYSSMLKYRFTEPDIYDIVVTAMNNISSKSVLIEPAIRVQDPILEFSIHHNSWVVLGEKTKMFAHYQPTSIYNQVCYFGFDYGDGQIWRYTGIVALTESTISCYYVDQTFEFTELGKHFVTVHAYNMVSNMSKAVEFWVIPSLQNVSVEIVNMPTEGVPVRVLVKDQGKAMVTENVYFSWKFGGEPAHYTNSPVFELEVNGVGPLSLNLNASTPRESDIFPVDFSVNPRSEVNLLLLHALFVAIGNPTEFNLQVKLEGPLIGWSKLIVNYSDGSMETYNGVTYRWTHIFESIGIHEVEAILVGSQGTTLEVMTSYVMVQEPIRNVSLHGPFVIRISDVEGYGPIKWRVEMDGGTNVLYRWKLRDTFITTLPEFEIELRVPGTYTLFVEVWNDISLPVYTKKEFRVEQIEHPLNKAYLKIVGNQLGKETQIMLSILGHLPFSVNISFGDGIQWELSPGDLSDMLTKLSDNSYIVSLGYVFQTPGDFNITVDVFNNVSCISVWDVFVPIVNVTLVTRSPWLLQTQDYVKVKAEVEGGEELVFDWDFQSDYEETLIKSYDNQTSIATQKYDLSGEYHVMFNVTGKHYPPPGIAVKLQRPFLVVDPINTVTLDVIKNSAELIGNSTSTVIFHVKSTGSHVWYLFEFGDSSQIEVAGSELPMRHVIMTMTAEARHIYHGEGIYKVKVTARNPLGNLTKYLDTQFYVQKPPGNLYFCQRDILPVTRYAGHVGEDIEMCANVTMGTNVTFDWKLGDQTDMVKHGSIIFHRYSTPGVRTVFVTAKNKVNKVVKSIKVFVNYELQIVELVPSKTIVALEESVQYTAFVTPNYNNTVQGFIWKFMFPSKSTGRERRGEQTIPSESNTIFYNFNKESGICLAKVTAKNAISRVDSEIVEIHVIEKIKRLEIILLGSPYERLVNHTIQFHSFHFAGTNVTYTWNFGDGSEPLITRELSVNKTFSKPDGYNVMLTASNPVSSQTMSMMLFVLTKSYCNQPEVNIINQPDSKVYHSKHYTLEANVVTDCNLTSALLYKWSIDGRRRKDLETNKRVLIIPPRSLSYGIHTVQFMVKMNNTIVYKVKAIQINVVPSPLVSLVKGGIYRRISKNQIVVLDGSDSYDPDVERNGTFSYEWSCHYNTRSGNHGNKCFQGDLSFNNSSCNVSMEDAVLIFPGECLTEASNYTFNLTVFAENRQSDSVYQILSVTMDTILDVKISRPLMVDPINADRKLSFNGKCVNCPPGSTYTWSLKQIYNIYSFNLFSLVRAHDLECVEANGTTYYMIVEQEKEKLEQDNGNLTTQGQGDDVEEKQTGEPSEINNNQSPIIYDKIDPGWTLFEGSSPALPDGIEIQEGDLGSDVLNRRRRKRQNQRTYLLNSRNNGRKHQSEIYTQQQSGQENDTKYADNSQDDGQRYRRSLLTETTTFSYPEWPQEGHPGGRIIKYPVSSQFDITENTDTNPPRRIPTFKVDAIREGTPGESGSSGARQYPGGYPPISEAMGNGRTHNYPREEDTILGSGADDKNRVESIKRMHGKVHTILDQRPLPVYLKPEQTKTGLHSESLVIKPGVLKQGLTYIVELNVFNKELGLEGVSKSSFEVNESPVNGRCSVEPQSGIELDTEFTLLCKEWEDKHQPFMYEVGYTLVEESDKILIYRGVNNYFTFKLPAGNSNKGNNVFVSIDILDSLLAKTSVCSIAIQVKPKSPHRLEESRIGTLSDSQFIYNEVTSKNGTLQKSLEKGEDAMSKVYISYLATKLNKVNESADITDTVTENGSHFGNESNPETKPDVADKQLRIKTRTELLKILRRLPVRDEAEILQSAQALAFTTAVPIELCPASLDLSLEILKSVTYGAQDVYGYEDFTPTGNLVPIVVRSVASIITATGDIGQNADETLETVLKNVITESINSVKDLVLNELKFHMTSEDPITASTDFFSVLSMRHSHMHDQVLEISDAKFQFPETFVSLLENQQDNQSDISSNQNCFQSHMTTFKRNPYSLSEKNQVNSIVSGLDLYDCLGNTLPVANLSLQERIQVLLPNIQPQRGRIPDLILRKWAMNIHQFNVTSHNLKHALHLVVELVPIKEGRLFPITVLLSYQKPPAPDHYLYKYEAEKTQNSLDIFLPAGSFNVTGKYYFGIVDATYNSGRLRNGEITYRNYTFKLWWGECLYWDNGDETWTPQGCWISQNSSYKVTKCECSHLTAFGGRFDLVPNELTYEDVENFFSPHRNPVVLTLISIVFILYFVLLLWCYHADQHDGQKGGIIYLLDNAPMDQQKYEITVETGIRSGAGTTAKISLILHGEEGMSETRELISEDNRPMFERNSRDKFILTLPDSIGKIWKVQIWHNNFGEYPSWYVSRIIVRDLNTGIPYLFICEKWLAVEEEDGKVEREFTTLEGTLHFKKALMSKTTEYMADFHTWLSIATCPSYSGFKRTERLTLCLTILLMYMCLNAVWYRTSISQYRGEFGLLDVSVRNVTVGAIICGLVIPVGLLLEFLFRRSKPKHASSVHCKDEAEDWDHKYPSGKPNEQESEDTSEHVPPVMTYSLLDQSIMNWPSIQTWAQKQWMKRQQSHVLANPGYQSEHSNESLGNIIKPTSMIVESPFIKQALSEIDQASSGFEDCSSLIRPKASVDSTHTTAAPSVAESMRTHKPKSLPDSFRMSKPTSELDSAKSSKAPSISSSGSHKSSVLNEKRGRRAALFYLPYWCRYIAWSICGLSCVGSAVITAMYGYRFGFTKSTLWLQSLFFSAMICIFISTPLMIICVVVYAALQYRGDPTTALDIYDIFNRVKAKQDLMKWKRQMELWFEGDALDRGVAARQRSRYLRFARPPQEKQLIEARKRVMKEKKALSLFRESVMFVVCIILLLVMAYSKTSPDKYRLNTAITHKLSPHSFIHIQSQDDWYSWLQSALLDTVHDFHRLDLNTKQTETNYRESSYIIGSVQLRQQRIQYTKCAGNLPYLMTSCLGDETSLDGFPFRNIPGLSYKGGYSGNFIFGNHDVYDGSGFTVTMNTSRLVALNQIEILKQNGWLDRNTRAAFVEFTLYNAPTNLFIAVDLLVEFSPFGCPVPIAKVTSTQVFRYTSWWDNILLACELLFFLVTMLLIKKEALKVIDQQKKYFTFPWNILNLIICVTSLIFCVCYVYRFVIVSDTVEAFRDTYYEQYVDLSFITLWDEILRWTVGILLFLSTVKSLRLLRYTKLFAVFGDVYRKARREVILFFGLFTVLLAAYTSVGHLLFRSTSKSYRSIWTSLMAVTAHLTSTHNFPEQQSPAQSLSVNVFLFFFCVFMLGFLTCYIIAILSHYYKSRKKRRLLAMSGKEAILFYWDRFQLWIGLKRSEAEEEPEIILPPEFTMAEIEYQVDELLFRMNALSGSHGLPEKPPCYLTDSDCTYGAGDDGISSGGSEPGPAYIEDRLEQRVQKIEDNLCSQEPFLAQLLKFDGVGMDILSMEKEKQLRSHLELEIFRQLQLQRQDLKDPDDRSVKPNGKVILDENNIHEITETPGSPSQDSTSSSDEAKLLPEKNTKSKYTPANITIQALQDLLTKSAQDYKDFHNENSSSNPDSPRDKITFSKIRQTSDTKIKNKQKPQNSSTSSSEKISPDLSLNHSYMYDRDTIRKPTKPTFLHSRDSSFSDAQKNSPIMKLRTHINDKPAKPEQAYTGVERLIESSSGSEQDGLQVGRKLLGKRSLRKTKSRGKGKGADEGLGSALVLDELDGEDMDFHRDFTVEGLQKELMDVYEERMKEIKNGGTEHTIRADVHHSSDSQ